MKVAGSVIASMASFVAGAVGAFVSVETYAMEKGQGGIKITLEEASWIGRTIQIENQVGEEALHCYSNLLGTLYSHGALLIESHRFF